MGKLHQWEFMIGRLGLCIVYHPKEWKLGRERGDMGTIAWWIRLGPIELMWIGSESCFEGSWLDREM